ncbi:hypothetical protein GO988_03390 [Hymenobacter sp. HMF4947]|uniref:Glycosyltransferase RgtA/B/C/D-like domain-containing protein n=1 Tax=Hymenobacter ginkgonis TaxID=2682976 RepID=A0A7K1TAZ0_9BACT|nr:hypothetical protein [Hymenobacter ginkgonis]MVN75361.1 hypothetical protein [Hymenobacter ginkgonis]
MLVGGGLALLLLPYLALAFYNQPYWDDYDFAALVGRLGQWGAEKYIYTTHTGRFFTILLTRLNPVAYGWPQGVQLLSLGWLGATGLAQALALRVLARQRLGWGAAGAWSVALLLGHLYVMPSPYAAFYWFSSAVVYQVPAILSLVFPVAVLQSLRAGSRWGRIAWYTLAVGAMLGVAGALELSLLLLGWALAWLCYLAYRRADRPALHRWLGLAGFALVAGVVVAAAPGNLVRMHEEHLGPAIPLWKVLGRAVVQTYMFLTEPRQVTALVVAPLLLARLGYRLRHLRPTGLRLPLRWGLCFVLGGVGLQMLFLSFTAWGYPAVRALNFMWFGLFTSWLVVLWAALPAGPSSTCQLLLRLRLPALLYVLVLVGGGPERAAWREWFENAPAYRRQLAARDAAIRRARQAGAHEVAVEPLQGIHPQYVLILGETLSARASASYNQDAARWYGLDSLRLSRPGLEPADVRVH